jgi:hypothetical protein
MGEGLASRQFSGCERSGMPVIQPEHRLPMREMRSGRIQTMKSGKTVLPDIVGGMAIALTSGAVSAVLDHMRAVSRPWLIWMFATPVLVGASFYAWHASEKTRNWDRDMWGYAAIGSLLAGTVSFAIDVLIGGSNGHYKSFLETAAHAGSPFGFPLTVLICPVGTIIAFGSWIRCLMLPQLKTQD